MNRAELINQKGLVIVYDGECPFCHKYVDFYRLKSRVEQLTLVDARQHPKLLKQLAEEAYDLNDGMLVVWQGELYYAAAAMRTLAELSAQNGLFNRLNRGLFTHTWLARIVYPSLVVLRKLFLALTGREGLS